MKTNRLLNYGIYPEELVFQLLLNRLTYVKLIHHPIIALAKQLSENHFMVPTSNV